MRESLLHKGLVTALLTLYCVFCSGCSVIGDKPVEEELSLVLAGIAGSDGLTFKGSTMLTKGGVTVPESMMFFGGTMQDHKKLNLCSLLPDKSPTNPKARTSAKGLSNKACSMKPYYSQLEKKEGKWVAQPIVNSSEVSSPLPLLNPLQQLEKLESMEKSVTKEAGVGRGTSVLRIELTPSEALKQLSDELMSEMEGLRPNSDTTGNGKETDQIFTQTLTDLWHKKNNELQQRLGQASVETVYHLTVDKKHSLPRKLTLNRKVTYSSTQNKSEKETYVSQVEFSDYR